MHREYSWREKRKQIIEMLSHFGYYSRVPNRRIVPNKRIHKEIYVGFVSLLGEQKYMWDFFFTS